MILQFNISIYFISYLLSLYFVRILDAHVDTKQSSFLEYKGGFNSTKSIHLSEGKYQSEPTNQGDTDITSLQLSEDEGESVPTQTENVSSQGKIHTDVTSLQLSEDEGESVPTQTENVSSQGKIHTDVTSLQLSEDEGESVPTQTENVSSQGKIHTDVTSLQLSEGLEKSEPIQTLTLSLQYGRQINSKSWQQGEGDGRPELHHTTHKLFLPARQTTEPITLQPDKDEDREEAGDKDDDKSKHPLQTRKIVQNSRQTYSTMQIGDENSHQHEPVKSVNPSTELNTIQYFADIHSDDYDYETHTRRARFTSRPPVPMEDIDHDDDVDDDDDEAVPSPIQKRLAESHRSVTDHTEHRSYVTRNRAPIIMIDDNQLHPQPILEHKDQEKLSSRIQRSCDKKQQETSTTIVQPGPTSKSSAETTTLIGSTSKSSDKSRTQGCKSKSSEGTTRGGTTSQDPTKHNEATTNQQESTTKSLVVPRNQPPKDKPKPPQTRQALKHIDGDSATSKQFKYIVYLKFRYKYKDAGGQSQSEEKEATGAIITPIWVITSLHIVPKVFVYLALNPPNESSATASYATESLEVDVEAGTVESGAAETTAGVQRAVAQHPGAVWCHPRGKRYRDENDVDGEVWYMEDVALVHLNGEPMVFNDYVGVIPLVRGSFPGNYLHCELVGFARAEGATHWKLYSAKVAAGDMYYCETLRGDTYAVWPKSYHICAYGQKGRRGCFGDSGSALVCNVDGTLTYVGVLNGLWWHVAEGAVTCSEAEEPFTHYVYCGAVDQWVREVTSPYFIGGGQVSYMNPRTLDVLIFSSWLCMLSS